MGNHVGHLGLLALVVGCSSEPSGPPPVQNYCDGLPVVSDTRARTLTDFGTPAPAGYAQALAIAPNGDLAGNGLFSGVQGSFRYTRAGQLIRLDHVTDFPTSVPAALSSGGRVFGRAFSPLGPFVGVVWESNGGVASISAPSGATFVPAAAAGSDLAAGTLFFSGGLSPKAAIWRQGNVTSLGTLAPGDGQSSAGAVNAVGQVVGTTQTSAAPTSDVFVWTEAGRDEGGRAPRGQHRGSSERRQRLRRDRRHCLDLDAG